MSIEEEFTPLTSGMSICLPSEEEILNPDALSELMTKNKVDALICTPSYFDVLLSAASMTTAIKALKVLDLGGSAFIGEHYERIRAINHKVVVINGYGPTETTSCCTSKQITSSGNITIGTPDFNTFCFIIDEELNELPHGEAGELLICGKGVGRGYINLEKETKNAFVTFRGMKAYRSGDLARIDEKGEIEYHGRIDSQVKLRGLRIELGEVENVMERCAGVARCAAASVDDRYLCLYYVPVDPKPEESEQRKELRAFAKEHLPGYMVPGLFIRLEEMPYTANWKIDRASLPTPELIYSKGQEPDTPMQTTGMRNLFPIMPTI